MIKRIFICLFTLLFMMSLTFANVISDNDGSAFITKAEFDSLRDDFQNQINSYNTQIDNKIDDAIASFLSGINISKEGLFNNIYSQWNPGTDFVWGNNTGYKTSKVLGGGSSTLYVNELITPKSTTATYSNNVTNNIFLATGLSSTGSSSVIYLKPRQHKCMYYEVIVYSFAQNATATSHNMTHYGSSRGFLAPLRNGSVKSDNVVGYTYPQFYIWHAFVRETITKSSSLCSTFSPNRTATEYYIKEDGDEDTECTINEIERTKGTYSGDFTINNNQSFTKTINLGWQKTSNHNNLIIYEWSQITGQEEQIKSGAPVAYVSEDDCQVSITYTTNKAGTLYVYSSVRPYAYSSLGTNDWCTIANVGAVANNKVTINKCSKGDEIRAIFIPSSGTGNLSISEIKYKKNQ